ncbi:ABC transporter permease [Compostimonas suwonensis]|uniref:Ribose transport system permease protein/L-arabinose transport system permease protein n=1 Tax=Compostimonas suwonensis TaxID=1048394 RepID=A0A2M9C3P8_9MICO|nr:ABC transporter permease [Compostimonas suwonensis]PJJ65155.1 ribose transport system permease protein/L-arabinose transport system permease protein [Compostimonas suwonensis]
MTNQTVDAPTSPPTPAQEGSRFSRGVLSALKSPNVSLIIALIVLIAILTILRPSTFLSWDNLLNIAVASVLVGLCALAQTLVILTGGIDISIGSTVGLSSVVCALVAAQSSDAGSGILAILTSIAVGAACGIFNAVVITIGRVSPLIATLGTFTAFQGLNYIVTEGRSTAVLNRTLNDINSIQLAGIPLPVVILVVAIIVFAVFMKYTDFGRNIYAVGGNPTAARLAGINVRRYLFGIYTLGGVVGGLAGAILTAKQGAGIPASGAPDLALLSITAVVLGGAALTGGVGTIFGTVLGVLILGVLENGLLLLNVSALYQPVPRGLLLIIAVLIQQWRGQIDLRTLFRGRPLATRPAPPTS